MLKKLCASLLALLILASFSVTAYAGQTDNGSNSTQPVSSSASPTGSAVKSTTTSKSPVTETASGSAFNSSVNPGESTNTTKGALGNKSVKKPVFEEVFNDVLKDGTAIKNDYFIMEITNPQMDKESTVYKSYVLSGNSKYDDVIISIAKFNEDTREYEPMYNTDGESSWEIGEYRLFSKEILLADGPNKIKMMAYRTSQKEEALKENIQVDCFTISLLKESLFTKAANTFTTFFGLKKQK